MSYRAALRAACCVTHRFGYDANGRRARVDGAVGCRRHRVQLIQLRRTSRVALFLRIRNGPSYYDVGRHHFLPVPEASWNVVLIHASYLSNLFLCRAHSPRTHPRRTRTVFNPVDRLHHNHAAQCAPHVLLATLARHIRTTGPHT